MEQDHEFTQGGYLIGCNKPCQGKHEVDMAIYLPEENITIFLPLCVHPDLPAMRDAGLRICTTEPPKNPRAISLLDE